MNIMMCCMFWIVFVMVFGLIVSVLWIDFGSSVVVVVVLVRLVENFRKLCCE